MPVYYNLSSYSSTEGLMDLFSVTDLLMKGIFSLFLVSVLGIWIIYQRLERGDSTNDAIITGSFYSFLLALILYASSVYGVGLIRPGLYMYIPMVILVVASSVKWYNNR